VKPVRGAFSVHTSHIADPGALTIFLSRPCVREFTRDYLGIHHRLQQHFAPDMPDACCFLAETPLRGLQVTVEGFVQRGRVEILGVVDSIRDARTGSFVRFEYPSALPHEIQLRMVRVAESAIAALGLDNTMFNIEMMYDVETAALAVIEVN